jgi:uncharacterized protein (TIGR02246 family)
MEATMVRQDGERLIDAPKQHSYRDELAIREHLSQFVAAWNRGDAPAIAALLHPDVTVSGMAACAAAGLKSVEKYYGDALSTFFKSSKSEMTVSSIRFIRPDVAIIEGSNSVRGAHGLDGSEAPQLDTLFTIVATKENGRWGAVAINAKVPGTPIEGVPGVVVKA